MTIPVSPVQIQPPLAPRQPSILEQVGPILEQITQQKVANAQLENYRSLAEERKMAIAKQAQELQDQADAAKAFYNHLSGTATTLKPEPPSKDGTPSHQGINGGDGTLMPLPQFLRSLSPGAAFNYQKLISDYNASVLQGHQATASRVEAEHNKALTDVASQDAIRAARANQTDTNVTRILDSYKGKLGSVQQQARLISDLATEDPNIAEKMANTFNVGNGRFQHILSPLGDTYTFDSKAGKWLPAIGNVGAQQPAPAEIQAVAKQGHDIVVRMLDLLKQDPNANNWTMTAQAARNVQPHGFLGALVGTTQPALQTPAQAEYSQLSDNLLHLVPALWPRGGQRGQYIMENLRSSFVAPGGSSAQARASGVQTVRSIDQHFFIPLSAGKRVDLRSYPGWQQAAQDALTGATSGAGATPNPTSPYRPENPYQQP